MQLTTIELMLIDGILLSMKAETPFCIWSSAKDGVRNAERDGLIDGEQNCTPCCWFKWRIEAGYIPFANNA